MREATRAQFAELRSQYGQPRHDPYPAEAVPDDAVDLALRRFGEWLALGRAGLIVHPESAADTWANIATEIPVTHVGAALRTRKLDAVPQADQIAKMHTPTLLVHHVESVWCRTADTVRTAACLESAEAVIVFQTFATIAEGLHLDAEWRSQSTWMIDVLDQHATTSLMVLGWYLTVDDVPTPWAHHLSAAAEIDADIIDAAWSATQDALEQLHVSQTDTAA